MSKDKIDLDTIESLAKAALPADKAGINLTIRCVDDDTARAAGKHLTALRPALVLEWVEETRRLRDTVEAYAALLAAQESLVNCAKDEAATVARSYLAAETRLRELGVEV